MALQPMARYEVTSTTGTINVPAGTGVLVINAGPLLAALTINMPAGSPPPSDQDELLICFRTAITLLTVSGTGLTGLSGLAISVGQCMRFYYDLGSGTAVSRWHRQF